MFKASVDFADHFTALFSPVTGEFELANQYPDSAATLDNMVLYQNLTGELGEAVQPELELIQSRIIGPLKEFKELVKAVRKSITKREHKVNDFPSTLPPASAFRQRNLTFISWSTTIDTTIP